MESDPVQVRLELYHDANGDGCEAWLSETLALDLAGLAQAWRDSYGDGPGQMTVHIDEFALDYAFDRGRGRCPLRRGALHLVAAAVEATIGPGARLPHQ